MGDIADSMLNGEACEMCGEELDCEGCEEAEIPAYCSLSCAEARGTSEEQVCNHSSAYE